MSATASAVVIHSVGMKSLGIHPQSPLIYQWFGHLLLDEPAHRINVIAQELGGFFYGVVVGHFRLLGD